MMQRILNLSIRLAMILAMVLGLLGFEAILVLAQNPPPTETYFVPLPDDWLMQHMEDIDTDGGSVGDPYTPVRSVIGISISATDTYIYWDQWEDGSYDADIANPGGNVYNATTNPDGTQIWGDNDTTNGYPPRFRDQPNTTMRDTLNAGDVIVLDNLVPISSSGGSHGPWLGGRVATQVYYDGKDKFAATLPVAATRAGWSEGDIDGAGGIAAAGSMFSDATSIEPTKRWGTDFIVPIAYSPPLMTTPFDYSHVTVQASQNGTTVCVDVPPIGACDYSATINQGQQYDPTPMPNTSSPQGVPVGTEIRTNFPVQVVLVTGDVGSTWATRWYNIKPFDQWTNDYYQPVGTSGASSAVWVYNPNDKQITITIERPTGTFSGTCAAKSSCKMPDIPAGLGGHGTGAFTDGSGPAIFYPVSVTEATGAQLYDWGYSLLPSEQLSDEVLVGWAPGCTTVTGANECFDNLDTSSANDQAISRSPVWVTPLQNTTIYVDLDGGGVDCNASPPTGAERTINATALTSYNIVDDPAGSVCDAFNTESWSANYCNTDWATSWVESDNSDIDTGSIAITSETDQLRFQNYTSDEAGDFIYRDANLNGQSIARLKFTIGNSGGLGDDDDIAVEVSGNNGGAWTTLETFDGPTFTPNPSERVYNLPAGVLTTDFRLRFRIVDSLESGDYWYVDNLTISFGTSPWDFDMSGARLVTCNGTQLATAWGQQPSYSYSGDDQALDMGTVLFALGSKIDIEKSVSPTLFPYEAPTPLIATYTFVVSNPGNSPLTNVTLVDDFENFYYPELGLYCLEYITDSLVVEASHAVVVTSEIPLQANLGTMNSGEAFTITLGADVTDCGIGEHPNVAVADSDKTAPVSDDATFVIDGPPSAVELARFEAAAQEDGILLEWETASELDNLGFNLYRSTALNGDYVQLNAALIPAQNPGAVFGGIYTWVDEDVTPGVTYFYKLEDVDIHGVATLHGPVQATALASGPSAVSLTAFSADGGALAGGGVGLWLPLALGTVVLWGGLRKRK